MDDRDWAAPVPLTADAPVAQAELGFARAVGVGFQVGDDGVEGSAEIEIVVLARVDAGQPGLVAIPVLPLSGVVFLAFTGIHLSDWQAVLVGEFEIALIVCGYGHHRAFAVAPQHVVGDEYRQLVAGERVNHKLAGGHALLLHGGHVGLGHGAGFALGDKRCDSRITLGGALRQRMFGGHGDIGRAHQGVGAGGVDLELAIDTDAGLVVVEHYICAEAFADPVALHGLDLFRPAIQFVQATQQFIRVGGDLEVVHRDFALLDQRAGTPAAAIDHLLVGQYSLVHRVPVDATILAVDHTFLEQAGEQPLLPAVVIRLAGGDFARPVHSQTQRLQLALHVLDVFVGPLGRRDLVFHRGVFRRHTERVPAHGLQHVFTLHALVAADYVTDGVVTHMAHVQLAARVGEHRQAVEGLLARLFAHYKGFLRVPMGLRGGFDFTGRVLFLHGYRRWE